MCRREPIPLFLLLTIMFSLGCSTLQSRTVPVWVKNRPSTPGIIYGVGFSDSSEGRATQKSEATVLAASEIGIQFSSFVQSSVGETITSKEDGDGVRDTSQTLIRNCLHSEIHLRSWKIIKTVSNHKGTWVLAKAYLRDLQKEVQDSVYSKIAKANQLANEIDRLQQNGIFLAMINKTITWNRLRQQIQLSGRPATKLQSAKSLEELLADLHMALTTENGFFRIQVRYRNHAVSNFKLIIRQVSDKPLELITDSKGVVQFPKYVSGAINATPDYTQFFGGEPSNSCSSRLANLLPSIHKENSYSGPIRLWVDLKCDMNCSDDLQSRIQGEFGMVAAADRNSSDYNIRGTIKTRDTSPQMGMYPALTTISLSLYAALKRTTKTIVIKDIRGFGISREQARSNAINNATDAAYDRLKELLEKELPK